MRRLAGPTIEFLGFQTDAVVRDHLGRCRALLFPGEEDIGLTPIEAQASGRPVIAYGKGGALETVIGFFPENAQEPESSTGVFFAEPTPESLVEAIRTFESVESRFSSAFMRAQAERFDVSRFRTEMFTWISQKMAGFERGTAPARDLVGV